MPRIMRKFEFDSAHRVLRHESKCKHLHGHRYVAEVTVSSLMLDDIGRVIDFSKVKEIVGGWIDINWDHNIILNDRDPLLKLAPTRGNFIFDGKLPFVMPGEDTNPTAENMAKVLYEVASGLLIPYGIECEDIVLWETPNCCARYGHWDTDQYQIQSEEAQG